MIEVTIGSVATAASGQLSLWAAYRKTKNDKEISLQDAEIRPSSGLHLISPAQVVPSCHARYRKNWITKRLDPPNNSYIKFILMRTRLGSTFRSTQHQFIVRPRTTAALNEIQIDCPIDQYTTRNYIYLTGRFDILTKQQVEELGLHVSDSGSDERHLYEQDVFMDIITVTQKEKEIEPWMPNKVSIAESAAGEKVAIARLPRRRRLHL
jgi:hypothetical protein